MRSMSCSTTRLPTRFSEGHLSSPMLSSLLESRSLRTRTIRTAKGTATEATRTISFREKFHSIVWQPSSRHTSSLGNSSLEQGRWGRSSPTTDRHSLAFKSHNAPISSRKKSDSRRRSSDPSSIREMSPIAIRRTFVDSMSSSATRT